MGFRPPRLTAKVIGTDDYEGLEAEVVIRPVPFNMMLDFSEKGGSGDLKQMREAFAAFGDAILVSWNLEDEQGQPVPATGAGMLSQDPTLMNNILSRWLEVMQQPPLAPGEPSESGPSRETEPRPLNGVGSPALTH